MNKVQKIDYINSVFNRFYDAKNHGKGGSWWYPSHNVIAYNVKMHGNSKDIDDVRKKLTARQNGYYSDNTLYEVMQEQETDEANGLAQDILIEYGLSAGYAGRSGGWLEVQYNNEIDVDDIEKISNVNYQYKIAKTLDNLENEVAEYIKSRHSSYTKYKNTDDYVNDIIERLSDDEEIGEIYKSRAKSLLDKLN